MLLHNILLNINFKLW